MTEDADVIERAVLLILKNRLVEARVVLTTFPAADPFPIPKLNAATPVFKQLDRPLEPAIKDQKRFEIYDRDGWKCRYCRRKVVVPPVLRYLRLIFADFKGASPGYHLPVNDTEPGIIRVYPHVDHIHPQKYGGGNRHENLATACDRCNTAKSDEPGWTLRPIVRDDWRGLLPHLGALAAVAGHFEAKEWLKLAAVTRTR